MKKDLYTVFIFKSGEKFYFKNNKLHREEGYAIVSSLVSSKDKDAEDEHLYNIVFPNHKNITGDFFRFKFSDGSETMLEHPSRYIYKSSYYLDGIYHSEEAFKIYHIEKLQNELASQLNINETVNKKIKV
jgi:hypothetical protein